MDFTMMMHELDILPFHLMKEDLLKEVCYHTHQIRRRKEGRAFDLGSFLPIQVVCETGSHQAL